MKIALVSDLHYEFLSKQVCLGITQSICQHDFDVLVLAGDITANNNLTDVIANFGDECGANRHVLFTPGNHEYYKKGYETFLQNLQNLPENVTYLQRTEKSINGVTFVGATAWYQHINDGKVNDPKVIANNARVLDEAIKDREFLESSVDADVVVTHFLPCQLSIPDRFLNSGINRFFYVPYDSLIYGKRPALWLHGHTHDPCDYTIDRTRVLCNPLGYPTERSAYEYGPKIVRFHK